MEDIKAAAVNLVKAIKDVYETTGAFAIDIFDDDIRVHLQPEEFEKILEGRDVRLVKRSDREFPYQREVVIGEVKFFCLLSEEEKAKTPVEAVCL